MQPDVRVNCKGSDRVKIRKFRDARNLNEKALRAGCASRGVEVSCKQHRSSAKESQATLCSQQRYLDLMKFALVLAFTDRHACRILYIDKHVHEDCHNDSGNHVKYGVLF